MTSLEPRDRAFVVVGVALIIVGVVLWLTLGHSAYGLVSGVGVVFLYPVVLPRIERWRRQQSS